MDIELPCLRLGTEYGGYAVLEGSIDSASVVYSLGLGEDISFDLALMALTRCQVYGFDPTPRSVAWVRAQNPPAGFHVRELGLAGYDGKASFTPPQNPAHISHSMVHAAAAPEAAVRVEFEVKRLATVMRELGHTRLDLLKMDIEGAEYEVLDDLLSTALRPRQILVEFHHGMHGIPLSRTENSLERLSRAGYRVFDRKAQGREFSLVLAT